MSKFVVAGTDGLPASPEECLASPIVRHSEKTNYPTSQTASFRVKIGKSAQFLHSGFHASTVTVMEVPRNDDWDNAFFPSTYIENRQGNS
ncbi:MAG: hypothetical protein GY795_40600 [Desulfobacterales bacterium]|nr:hypothetical protein [Desulfobacterales bacterium]